MNVIKNQNWDPLTIPEIVDLSERIGEDLLILAKDTKIQGKDLIIVLAFTQRLLESVIYNDDLVSLNHTQQEANAIHKAVSHFLEAN